MPIPKIKRVLLKLSGEVLMGDQQFGIDPDFVAELAKEVKAGWSCAWSSAAAISFAGWRERRGGWTGRRPITWACWRRS
jgi:hypothetical protein